MANIGTDSGIAFDTGEESAEAFFKRLCAAQDKGHCFEVSLVNGPKGFMLPSGLVVWDQSP